MANIIIAFALLSITYFNRYVKVTSKQIFKIYLSFFIYSLVLGFEIGFNDETITSLIIFGVLSVFFLFFGEQYLKEDWYTKLLLFKLFYKIL